MQKKHNKLLYKILITASIMALLASRTVFFRQSILEDIGSAISYPFLVLAYNITKPLKSHLKNKNNLAYVISELQKKRSENESLLFENTKLKASLYHKELTSELSEFQERYNINGIFSKILVRNIDKTGHYYLINKGSRDGIIKDMVMIYKFQLVGRVSDVYSNHSKVKLITDFKSKIAVYANMTNARGIVLGQNHINTCKLAYVSHLSKVEPGDLVLSSGQGLVFPEGFCLGKITHNEIQGLMHKVEISPLVDLSEINFGILIDRTQIVNF